MSKSIVVDRVKIIAEMARQNLTGEELAQKAGVGRSAVIKMRKGQPVWRTTAGHVAAALGVTVDDEEFHRCEWTEVVKQATRQGWLKFYPLDKDKPPSTVPEFESAGDQISRIIENLKRKNGA